MSTITNILYNQEARFDDHSRGLVERKLEFLHFHKKQNGNNKKYNDAEIRIYLNGETKWETQSYALEKEIKEVLDNLSIKEKIEFVYNMSEAAESFFGNPNILTDEDKLNIRKKIVKAFFSKEYDKGVIESKPFKQIFGTNYSDIKVKITSRTYRISLITSNGIKKKIIIKDITNDKSTKD